MAACPRGADCVFHQTIEPSVIKRVRYASAYVYCRGGRHEECAIHSCLVRGEQVSRNLMPDGAIGDYMDEQAGAAKRRFLVIEDSPVFAALAASTLASHFAGAEIVRHSSFTAAAEDLRSGDHTAVVCGFGLGDGKTAHHVRELTTAPIVVLTGRPGEIDAPRRSQVVAKSAGPEALAAALRAVLA